MREVAVTEGDKVEAQLRLGFSVNGYGVGDLVARRRRGDATPRSTSLIEAYIDEYDVVRDAPAGRRAAPSRCATARGSSSACARFLADGGFSAFTDTFEDLHGLNAAARPRPSSG